MVVWLYGSHKFITILLRFLTWNVPFWKKKGFYDTEPIHTLCIVSFCILGSVYLEKCCPGKEGHPSSRVNFRERLYEKKADPFVQTKSARSYSYFAAIASSQIVFFFLTFLFSPKETRASAADLLSDPYLNKKRQCMCSRCNRVVGLHVPPINKEKE